MLDLCVQQNIAWVPFFPLGGRPLSKLAASDQPSDRDTNC
jgi:hypothetical protein